jgi:peptidoglycan/LPS O-acetylase OafA/YrhL
MYCTSFLITKLGNMLASPYTDGTASAVPASSVQYRPAIDGLRAVAVLAVFVFHLKHQWLPGGFVGVDVFFVISGYLITSILLREYAHKSFSLGKFYQRRIARLFPALYAVALVTLVSAYFIYSAQDFASVGASLTAVTLSIANLKLMFQGNYFTLSPDAQPFLHCWSLSVEEQFYMLFPVTLLFLYLKANKYKTLILSILCGISLLACIALTQSKPQWAFYLLPTRAWELLAGSILANISERQPASHRKLWESLSLTGLVLIFASLFVINERSVFPGYLAILPVLGTVCFIGPHRVSGGLGETILSWRPMVLIGQMSYSLYLWHWPIFSFVDYRFYLASPLVRVGLKIVLSLTSAALCFFLIENRGRIFFNDPRRRHIAFAFLGCSLLLFVPLGIAVRRTNYVEAEMKDVAHGGIVFNQASMNGSMVLMGDSNGAMYGRVAKEIAKDLSLRLNVISVPAGDPLPRSSGQQSQLWLNSLAVVKREKPDFLVLVCNWQDKLKDDKGRLGTAVDILKLYARYIILVTQPPVLPEAANRESMRNGSRPPFIEDSDEHTVRMSSNALVKNLNGSNVIVIDIDPIFTMADGGILFTDHNGNQLYHDRGHLAAAGAELVKLSVLNTITDREPNLRREATDARVPPTN